MRTLEDRFWSKVENSSGADCWQWLGGLCRGYGEFGIIRNGKYTMVRAHRVAWELCRGPIPAGKWVLHRCDNPGCCNPSHLFLGTHVENMADMVKQRS